MNAIQLDFFKTEEECEFDAMRQDIKEIHQSTEKVRKKLFAENTETKECIKTLIYLMTDLIRRVEIIENGICKK